MVKRLFPLYELRFLAKRIILPTFRQLMSVEVEHNNVVMYSFGAESQNFSDLLNVINYGNESD